MPSSASVVGGKRKAPVLDSEDEPELEDADKQSSEGETEEEEEEVAGQAKRGRGARAKAKAKGKAAGVAKGSKVMKKRKTEVGRNKARKPSAGTKWCRGFMLQFLSLDF